MEVDIAKVYNISIEEV
jgi:hypothetical protein